MTENESREVEKVLLHISDARTWTRITADVLEKEGAAAHVVEALRSGEQQLAGLHRTLAQGTYYAVPEDGMRLAV